MIEPGVYDVDGTLHFYPDEYLAGHGLPVNDHNLALVERVFKERFAELHPGVPIHDEWELG